MRTGKRLPNARTEIVIQFKGVPHHFARRGATRPNRLVIAISRGEHHPRS
jgi:glucose-6-phosphate 1-dehydrogenase